MTLDLRKSYDNTYAALFSLLAHNPRAVILVQTKLGETRKVGYKLRMILRARLGPLGRQYAVHEMESGKELIIRRKV